jgi:hypothetical protein
VRFDAFHSKVWKIAHTQFFLLTAPYGIQKVQIIGKSFGPNTVVQRMAKKEMSYDEDITR